MAAVLRRPACPDDATLVANWSSWSATHLANGVRLYDDVFPALASLRERGVKTALVSNCSHSTRPVVRAARTRAAFDRVVLSFEARAMKPDPAIYSATLEQLGGVAARTCGVRRRSAHLLRRRDGDRPRRPADPAEERGRARRPARPPGRDRPGVAPVTSSRERRDRRAAREVPAQALREGARAAPGGAREDGGVGRIHGDAPRGDLRGPRCRGQGRHDQADDRAHEPADHPARRAAEADRTADDPVVLPAVRRTAPRRGRDRAVRPQLVQPRRHRARAGVLHARRALPVPPAVPDLRAAARGRRHHPDQVLVLGERRGAGAPVRGADHRPDAPLEALGDRPVLADEVGRLLAREGRDVRAHRHPRGAVVRRRRRQQEAGADQLHRPSAVEDPVRGPSRSPRSSFRTGSATTATCGRRAISTPTSPITWQRSSRRTRRGRSTTTSPTRTSGSPERHARSANASATVLRMPVTNGISTFV